MSEVTINMAQSNNRLLNTIADYGAQLKGFIRKRVRSVEDAEDILQDVWFQLSSLTDFESIENVGAWIYTLARNRITDSFRKKQPILYEDFSIGDDADEMNIHDLMAATSDLPEDHVMKKMFWQVFFDALDELPVKQREAFVKNELENLSLQQIADQNNENIKTIISRKRYAMMHLQKRLKEFYNDYI